MGLDPEAEMKKSSGGCFIATAVYGSELADEVICLSRFRDEVLLKNSLGRVFVDGYYRISPPIADWIAGRRFIKSIIRYLLIRPLVEVVRIFTNTR